VRAYQRKHAAIDYLVSLMEDVGVLSIGTLDYASLLRR